MRRKKHKHTRRAVTFYKINYGFHEPYKVLLDGNFIHATLQSNLADLENHIPKLLGARCKLFTTKCVTQELRSMGAEFADTTRAAKAYQLHTCAHHASPISAADCLREQIGRKNEDHWFVATQDKFVKQSLAKVAGCPILFASVNGLHLETPSEMAKERVKQDASVHQAVPRYEQKAEALKDLEELRPKQTTSVRYRTHRAKGPNPLSMKKKIQKPQQAGQAAVTAPPASQGEGTARKRSRKKTAAPQQ